MGGSWHCFTHITSDPATGYRGIQSSKPQDTNLCAIHAKRVTIMPKDSHFLFCLGQTCSYGSYGFGCKEHDGIHCFEESEIEQQVLQWWYLVFVWKRFVCLFGTHILATKYTVYGPVWNALFESFKFKGVAWPFFWHVYLKNLHLWSRKYRHFLQSLQWQDVQLARRLRGERT